MITIRNLAIRRGTFHLTAINLHIPAGKYAVLMGPSGCGKSTLLECIAGLLPAAGGQILADDRDITSLCPADRGLGYVPQDGALFRGLSVRDNIGFALAIRQWPAARITARIAETAADTGLTGLLDRGISGLSGGERQRVALARALAFRPGVLWMDEPLAALDEQAREELFQVLEWVKARAETTVLHVTHSAAEADRLADLRLYAHTLFLP